MTDIDVAGSTALIVVDVQNLFVTALGVDGPRVVSEVNAWVDRATRDEMPVFYTRDVEPVELPDGDPDRLTDLHPNLDVAGIVVDKGQGAAAACPGSSWTRVRARAGATSAHSSPSSPEAAPRR